MKKIKIDTVKAILEVVSAICEGIVKVMNGKSQDPGNKGRSTSKSEGKEAA